MASIDPLPKETEKRFQKQQKELMKLRLRLESLWDLNKMIDKDFKTICDHVLDIMLSISESKYAFLGFVDEGQANMTLHAWSSKAMKDCEVQEKPIHYPIKDAGIWADAIRNKKHMIVNNYHEDIPGKKGMPTGHVELSRFISVPVIFKKKVLAIAVIADKAEDYNKDDVQQIEAIMSIALLILEHKKKEEDLIKSEQKIRALFDQTYQFIGLTTPEGFLIEANRAALKHVNVKASDVLGVPFWETPWWTHDPAQQIRLKEAIKAAAQGKFVRFEATHLAADGTLHSIDFSLKPFRDDKGKIIYLIPEGRDITERKQIEKRLYKEKEFLNAILNNIEDGIVACDEKGFLTMFNRATRIFHGIPLESLSPEEWAEHYGLYHADGKTLMEMEDTPLYKALQDEFVNNVEMVIIPGKGKKRTLVVSGQSLYEASGEKMGAVVSMHDVTDQKLAEEALRLANEALEEKVKDRTAELARANEELLEEISERRKAEQEREKLITELQEALSEIKRLQGILPICASCKKIRDDKGYWKQVEVYIRDHSEVEFSHSICPECLKTLYPDIYDKLDTE